MAYIVDVLMSIRSVLIGAHSSNHRAPPVHPYPRPTTALDQARAKRVKDRHNDRVLMLLPKSAQED